MPLSELLYKLRLLAQKVPDESFEDWARRNQIREPNSPLHFYDNRAAWGAGVNRTPMIPMRPEFGHFPDTYKLPGHPTFSEESIYAKPPLKWGRWKGDKFIPFGEGSYGKR